MSRLVVIGDLLLDRDIDGVVDRLCPDAPAPVVDERTVVERPGGAGLAAVLGRAAGHETTLLTGVAGDGPGASLRRAVTEAGVHLVAADHDGTTVEKTRIRVDGRSVLRLDRGDGGTIGPLPHHVHDLVAGADAVLLSDYGRGMSSHPEVRRLVEQALTRNTPVVWDPHPRGAAPEHGTTLVTPNRDEAVGFDLQAGNDPAEAGKVVARMSTVAERLRRQWRVRSVAVTLGERGAALAHGATPFVVPSDRLDSISDTCGAGDAFAAAAAGALADGALVSEAVEHAVATAGAFVARGGAGALRYAGPPGAEPSPPSDDAAPGTVVATGGCFDVLHRGHVATLQRARLLGDRLVVLLNSDASVRRLKGEGRPVQPAEDRAAVLRSLACVDEVLVFDDDTPVNTLRRLRPDIFVKGGDYGAVEIPESDVVSEWGGAVVTVPFLPGRSTTNIIHTIERGGSHVV